MICQPKDPQGPSRVSMAPDPLAKGAMGTVENVGS
jgi:hypothetical protein